MTPQPREGFDLYEEAPWEAASRRNGSQPGVGLPWTPVDVGAILRGESVTTPPSVLTRRDGVCLLHRGRLNAFLGETESLKTWAALLSAKEELAQGHHVVMLDFEDTAEATVERLLALGATPEAICSRFTYVNPEGRFDDVAKAVIEEAIKTRGLPSLLITDSVTEAMTQVGLNPEKGTEVATFYAGFSRFFASLGAAVLLVDHVTKDRESRGRWAIGSERKLSGLTGAAYGFHLISPFGRGRTGSVKMTVSKDRQGHVRQHEVAGRVIATLVLTSNPDNGVTATLEVPEEATEGHFRPTHLMEQMIKVIATQPGLTKNALRGAVRGKNETKDLALELLVNEGTVTVESGPRGAHRHFVRPCESDCDFDGHEDAPTDEDDHGNF